MTLAVLPAALEIEPKGANFSRSHLGATDIQGHSRQLPARQEPRIRRRLAAFIKAP